VLLHTLFRKASCVIRDQLIKDENMPLDVSENLAQLKVSELIYLKALPRFRQMIERGQVRVTFPDHRKVRHYCKHYLEQLSSFATLIENDSSSIRVLVLYSVIFCCSFTPQV
jgi:hypothetical protein